jgi:hypothetical protein
MALNNVAIKHANPQGKPFRIYDGQGLYLQVTPAGGTLWRP